MCVAVRGDVGHRMSILILRGPICVTSELSDAISLAIAIWCKPEIGPVFPHKCHIIGRESPFAV